MKPIRARRALLMMALAPLVPQILGSAFNIWYNTVVIEPLLVQPGLKQRFIQTVIVYNLIVFPVGITLWLGRVYSFSHTFHRLQSGLSVAPDVLGKLRRRLIHLPWFAAAISVAA
jgi:hypothetical protein